MSSPFASPARRFAAPARSRWAARSGASPGRRRRRRRRRTRCARARARRRPARLRVVRRAGEQDERDAELAREVGGARPQCGGREGRVEDDAATSLEIRRARRRAARTSGASSRSRDLRLRLRRGAFRRRDAGEALRARSRSAGGRRRVVARARATKLFPDPGSPEVASSSGGSAARRLREEADRPLRERERTDASELPAPRSAATLPRTHARCAL